MRWGAAELICDQLQQGAPYELTVQTTMAALLLAGELRDSQSLARHATCHQLELAGS